MRLIDADVLYELLDGGYDLDFDEVPETKAELLQMINYQDTVDAVPVRHGKWVIEPDRTVMHCNVCGWAFEYYAGLEEEWNYCPHCGAETRGEKE